MAPFHVPGLITYVILRSGYCCFLAHSRLPTIGSRISVRISRRRPNSNADQTKVSKRVWPSRPMLHVKFKKSPCPCRHANFKKYPPHTIISPIPCPPPPPHREAPHILTPGFVISWRLRTYHFPILKLQKYPYFLRMVGKTEI